MWSDRRHQAHSPIIYGVHHSHWKCIITCSETMESSPEEGIGVYTNLYPFSLLFTVPESVEDYETE